mgnify:FL=1
MAIAKNHYTNASIREGDYGETTYNSGKTAC